MLEGVSEATATTAPPAAADPGLDETGVAERVARGQTNRVASRPSRSYGDILRANVFTRFNALLGTLWVIAMVIGPPSQGLFGFILLANTVIGVIQEIRAKRTLDQLAVLSTPRATVRRSGRAQSIELSDIVLDDVIELRRGDQLAVDGVVISSDGLEIDQSLLSGESEPVQKDVGDQLLSGSFVVAGGGLYRATHVGDAAYAQQLTQRAQQFTLVQSDLRDGINQILKVITHILPVMAVLLLTTQLRSNNDTRDALRASVAGLVAMVPEGLVLLTSLTFAYAVIRLGQRKALVQELAAVEMLARVDVVCFDKTGTLTEGDIHVQSLDVLRDGAPCAEALGALAAFEPAPDASSQAIAAKYPKPASWQATGGVAFSSARRWSAVAVQGQGAFVLGAPDVLLPTVSDAGAVQRVEQHVDANAAAGRRTLLLASARQLGNDERLPQPLDPMALVALEETLRGDAADTIGYFLSQGVAVKVISGDNPRTVAAVARSAGVPEAGTPLDGRQLPDDSDGLADAVESHGVFGRVAPAQKRAMVAALQHRGHVVGMTGDGVNDVLALKDADMGIAMGSGSGATRAVAQMVLLDGRFATLPFAVAEGRSVTANVERVGNLFLTKTVYAIVLAICAAITLLPYPLLSNNLSLVAALTIGIPGFFLALAPNARRYRRGFVMRIVRFAVPAGILVALATFGAYRFVYVVLGEELIEARTTAAIVLLLSGLYLVLMVGRPFAMWKLAMVAAMLAAFAVCLATPWLRNLFGLKVPPAQGWAAAVILVALVIAALQVAWWAAARAMQRFRPEAAQTQGG